MMHHIQFEEEEKYHGKWEGSYHEYIYQSIVDEREHMHNIQPSQKKKEPNGHGYS